MEGIIVGHDKSNYLYNEGFREGWYCLCWSLFKYTAILVIAHYFVILVSIFPIPPPGKDVTLGQFLSGA